MDEDFLPEEIEDEDVEEIEDDEDVEELDERSMIIFASFPFLAKKIGSNWRVLEYLEDARTVKDVSKRFGWSYKRASRFLNNLLMMGFVMVFFDSGRRYYLVSPLGKVFLYYLRAKLNPIFI